MTEESIEEIVHPTVGQTLRSAREAKRVSLESVAKVLCISTRQLTGLEEDHKHLICDVYTLGFLKSYAIFLELNGDEIVQKFKDQATHPQVACLSFPAPLPGRGMPSFPILGLSIVALLAIIGGWEWYGSKEAAPLLKEENLVVDSAPAPVIEAESSPLSTESIQPIETTTALTVPEQVILKVKEKAWVEVKNQNGDIILSQIFEPGETYEFENPKDLILKTGNTRGIQLGSGEKVYRFSSDDKIVKSDIPLDPEKWLE